MSAGRPPSAADQPGSRCSCSRAAAVAHWVFRCAVGVTTSSGAGRRASVSRAATRASVVLPAPGVATARKSGWPRPTKASSAACCHGRRRTLSLTGTPAPSLAVCERSPHDCSSRLVREVPVALAHPHQPPHGPNLFAQLALLEHAQLCQL